jgi:hypothetical protein
MGGLCFMLATKTTCQTKLTLWYLLFPCGFSLSISLFRKQKQKQQHSSISCVCVCNLCNMFLYKNKRVTKSFLYSILFYLCHIEFFAAAVVVIVGIICYLVAFFLVFVCLQQKQIK